MTTNVDNQVFSDLAIPPGETLAEELEMQGMTQKELAVRLGRPAQVINEIIKGKKAITPETALELEKVLGIKAHFWAALEAAYRMTLARNKDRDELQGAEEWLAEFPVREMEKRGWIQAGRTKVEKLRRLLEFLGVANPAAYKEVVVGYRMTPSAASKVSLGALAVWLRRGELEARGIGAPPYDATRFGDALMQIRGMTMQPAEEFKEALFDLCLSAGVVVAAVPELPKSGANGATRWLTDQKALIQLSLRSKWQDVFWFSFFHEAGHILLHRTTRSFIEGVNGADEALEHEANLFAADILIPQDDWNTFVSAGIFTASAIREFGEQIGIGTGIVVGRLQKEGILPWNAMTHLKERFQWITQESAVT